jgi:hypothetical protein
MIGNIDWVSTVVQAITVIASAIVGGIIVWRVTVRYQERRERAEYFRRLQVVGLEIDSNLIATDQFLNIERNNLKEAMLKLSDRLEQRYWNELRILLLTNWNDPDSAKTFNEKQIEVGRNIMMLQRYLKAGQRDAKPVEREAKLLSSNLLTLKELIKSELELASKY